MQHLQTAVNLIYSTNSDFSSGITSPIMSGTFFIHSFLLFFQHPFKQSCLFFGLNQENCTVAPFKANIEIIEILLLSCHCNGIPSPYDVFTTARKILVPGTQKEERKTELTFSCSAEI